MDRPDLPPKLEINNESLTIWDNQVASILYSKGFYGKPLGLRKPDPGELNRPLTLSYFDALYLFENNVIQLVLNGKPIEREVFIDFTKTRYENFEKKYLVYKYLRELGYIVRPGMKFGSDFAIYEEGPGIDHSKWVVHVESDDKNLRAIEIVRAGRLAASVKKRYLISTLSEGDQPIFYGFDRVKI